MPAATAATNQRRARDRSTSSRNVYSSRSSLDETSTTHAYTPLEHLDSESDGLMFDDDDAVSNDDLEFGPGHATIEGVTAADSARTTIKSRDLKFPICTCAPLQSASAAAISPPPSSSNSSSPSRSSGSTSTSSRSFLFPTTKAIAKSSVSLATTAATSFAGSESDYNAYVDLLQSQTRNITKRRRSSQQQGILPLSGSISLQSSASNALALSNESSASIVSQAVVHRRARPHPQQRHLRALEQQGEDQVDLDLSSSDENSASTSDKGDSRRGRSASPKPLASFTAPIQPLSPTGIYQDLPEAASVPDSEASSDVHQFDLDDYFAFKPKVLTAKLEALLAEAPHFAAANAEPYSYGGSDDESDEETDVESGDVNDDFQRSFSRSFVATSVGQRLCQPYASIPVAAAIISEDDNDDDEPASDPESDCSIASFVLPDLEFDEEASGGTSRNLTLHRTISYGVRTPPAALTLRAAAAAAVAPLGNDSIDDRLDKALAFARWNKKSSSSSRTSPSSAGLYDLAILFDNS